MIFRLAIIFFVIFTTFSIKAETEKKVVNGISYHILEADHNSIKVVWKDSKGRQINSFSKACKYLTKKGFIVKTVMNGGIFEPGGIPSGLLIQNGKVLRPVNRKSGEGNFYLKPNGIFLISSKGASVIETENYPLKNIRIQHAIQSGPMLLRNGGIHPKFNAQSKSRLHRNGVGILKNGKVVFAMSDPDSDKFPNLYEFSQLFMSLGCKDALFLDGNLSQIKSGKDIFKAKSKLGSIIAIIEGK